MKETKRQKSASLDLTNTALAFDTHENIAILKVGRRVFDDVTDLAKRERYLSFFETIDQDPNIKVLLIINDDGSYDEAAYSKFLANIARRAVDPQHPPTLSNLMINNFARSREIYLLKYLSEQYMNSRKIIIQGLQGSVVTPFFGLSLAADFRFATPTMRFCLPHVKYGLHPSGGLAFFLPRYLGQGKAIELLLTGRDISAKRALALGLVTEIFPKKDFEQSCIKAAKKLCQVDLAVIKTTKSLSYSFQQGVEDYFKLERRLLSRKI